MRPVRWHLISLILREDIMKIKELKNVTFIYFEDTHRLVIRDKFGNELYIPAGNIKSLVRFIVSQVFTIYGKTKKKTNKPRGGR